MFLIAILYLAPKVCFNSTQLSMETKGINDTDGSALPWHPAREMRPFRSVHPKAMQFAQLWPPVGPSVSEKGWWGGKQVHFKIEVSAV